MTEEIVNAILERVSSKGDLGVALLGFVLGYVLDLKFALVGLAPGTAAALGAAAATGAKNGAQAFWNHSRAHASHRRSKEHQHAALERAAAEIERLNIPDDPLLRSATNRLRSDRELWRKELITDQEFRGTIANFVDRYRRVMDSPPGKTSPVEEPDRVAIIFEDESGGRE